MRRLLKSPSVSSISMAAAMAALCHPGAARADGVASTAPAHGANESEHAEARPSAQLSPGATFGAVALSLWPGLGVGHAVIGEYGNTGWKFTAAEAASVAALFGGLAICNSGGRQGTREDRCDSWGTPLAWSGLGAFGVLRALEIADVLLTVSERNSDRDGARDAASLAPAVYALPGGGGMALGGQF